MLDHKCALLGLLILAIPYGALSAQPAADTKNKLYPLPIEEDFEITGTLSNPVWGSADVTFIEHEIAPNDEAPAPVETEVRVLYSKEHIYFGFIAHDPNPSKIRARIAERDNVFGDDYLGVILDTYGNERQAYEFFVNPLGVQVDAFRTANREDNNFEALWYSEGVISDSGYAAARFSV